MRDYLNVSLLAIKGAVCTVLLVLTVAATTKAQQVIHIENRRMADPEPGWSGDVSLQASLVQNLNHTFQTNNLAQLQYAKGRSRVLSISALNLNIFNYNRIRNDGYQHFRYNYELSERWSPEAFAQYQYNEWLKIGFRALHGAGVRFALLDNDSAQTKLFAGLSYMYEYEAETTDKIFRGHRANYYMSVGFPLGNIVHFDAIAYFQPNLQWIADIRASTEINIDLSITEKLSFQIVCNLVYDGAPPEEVPNIFYSLRNGLRYRF